MSVAARVSPPGAAWSLPPAVPPPEQRHLEALFALWNPEKAWQWLRAGAVPLDRPEVIGRLGRRALWSLGLHPNSSPVWHRRTGPLADPWALPQRRLPATPSEPWPMEASTLEGTSAGVLAVAVAHGWNPFEPCLPALHQSPGEPLKWRDVWGIEAVMGIVGQTRMDPAWRWALLDQMWRSPHRPALAAVNARRVCKAKKCAGMPWLQAAVKYREPLAF